jgi:hypothetical protein
MSDLLAEIRAKRQNIADKKTGMKKAYRFKQAKTLIRILPSWRPTTEAERPFFHDFGQAFIKDLDGNLLAVIGDRKMTYGEDDAVRDLISLAKAEAGTDATREHYHQMIAKQKHIVNAVVLNDPGVDKNTAEMIEFSQTQLDTIFQQMEKILEDGENPLDLDNGYDLEVEKEGTGLKTRYKFLFARRPSKVDARVMDTVTDLDSYVRSQFNDTDRAINAIKSISQGAALPAPDKSKSYTNGDTVPWGESDTKDKVEDAEYTVVDDAKSGVREPTSVNSREVSQSEIDDLLNGVV